jgi:predicted AlkP superfamily phosphohydrolase/phosphomutase
MSPIKRREFLKYGLAASAMLAGKSGFPPLLKARGRRETPLKVFILGADGMDPNLFQAWLKEGHFPAFERLLSQGDFRPLRTSIPPQSPVAWSNFITGMDPGGHGIFDFIHRDPETYIPIFSGSSTEEAKKTVRFGDYVVPLSEGKVKLLREGRAFWQILEEQDIPATVFKIPSNYPPAQTNQRTLSGMGTPDILGSYGICNFYTTKPFEARRETGGGARVHEVFPIANRIDAKLGGPINSFKRDRPETNIDFTVWVDPVEPVAKIAIQGQEFILREKEWSGWKSISFSLIPTQSIGGMCMFYLKEIRPVFKLYVTPINIDPADPALPISTPDNYSRELTERFGRFFTKGLPADTSALDNNLLDESEFLHLDDMVLAERDTILDYELDRFDSGLLFYYLSSTDQRQHMFWRLTDKNSPGYDPALASKYENVIRDIYIEADRTLDKVMRRGGKDTIIMVMSDHGFNAFNRSFNLNSWLVETGYHKLRNPWKQGEGSLFENTDWSRTRAYGIGLNGLYINLKGREAEGIVNPGSESENLIREIASKLELATDPKTGQRAILRAFVARDVYHGPAVEHAPDIVLGFDRGYRIAGESALGTMPKEVFADNLDKWSGDHMGAPEILPGILAVNRRISADTPSLYDLTPSILKIFGLDKPDNMIGEPIF